MNGRLVGIVIILLALGVGGAIYYLQVYGFYREVPVTEIRPVQLITLADGTAQTVDQSDTRAIDADSSPIRYRSCFSTTLTAQAASAIYVPAPNAEPRIAPGWFDCFDATAIGTAIEAGTMATFLSVKNIAYGVDRVVALGADGNGYSWHILNQCGTKAYDGTVVGEECPPPPNRAATN